MQRCDRCHGVNGNGNSINPFLPAIAGQRVEYLEKVLRDYRAYVHKSSAMAAKSDARTEADIGEPRGILCAAEGACGCVRARTRAGQATISGRQDQKKQTTAEERDRSCRMLHTVAMETGDPGAVKDHCTNNGAWIGAVDFRINNHRCSQRMSFGREQELVEAGVRVESMDGLLPFTTATTPRLADARRGAK